MKRPMRSWPGKEPFKKDRLLPDAKAGKITAGNPAILVPSVFCVPPNLLRQSPEISYYILHLNGRYNSMLDLWSEIKMRVGREIWAKDPYSYKQKTKGTNANLERLRAEAEAIRNIITAMGREPFEEPPFLGESAIPEGY